MTRLPSRRSFLTSSGAAIGAAWLSQRGNTSLLSGQDPASSSQIKLRAAIRTLDVNGKAANLMGLEQSNGKLGLNLVVNQRFDVLLGK